MGNTSQCGFLSTIEQQYKFIGEQKHFLLGQIKHFKHQSKDNTHFAIKKIKFTTQSQFKQYQSFLQLYQQICDSMRLVKANEYINPVLKQKQEAQQDHRKLNGKQKVKPFFYCNKQNFIFASASQNLSCIEAPHHIMLNIQYLENINSLKTIVDQKSRELQGKLQHSKINQNILLQLQNRIKLCEYEKIDRLPHKQRSIVNLFFNEVQILRMLDSMLTSLYGLKINGVRADSVRPELFFKCPNNQKILYFTPILINEKKGSNFHKSYDLLSKWLKQQNAKFHHNWTIKQKQLIAYIHPNQLQKLTEALLNQNDQNFYIDKGPSIKFLQKQNIYALGLIILQTCLLEPSICSKIYNVSICRKQQQQRPSIRKQVKYNFSKENLTIKLNQQKVQKYLMRMKTFYSEQFVELVQFMIFGTGLGEASKQEKIVFQQNPTYEDVISRLQSLISDNIQRINAVHNNSKSQNITQKNSRIQSLSRQISASRNLNNSLPSGSSLLKLPVQNQSKILSIELLKKHYKRLDSRLENVLIKSELETMKGSFAEKQKKIEQLILQDQQRILCQLNKINNSKPFKQKQTRFNYRRAELNPHTNPGIFQSRYPISINLMMPNKNAKDFSINIPTSVSSNQKRINNTTKTKKTILKKAKLQESLGSISQTINDNQLKNTTLDQTIYDGKNVKNTPAKDISKNQTRPDGSLSNFYEEDLQFSTLKSSMPTKHSTAQFYFQNNQASHHAEQKSMKYSKSPKELKSKQLYEIYLNEYKNLINSSKSEDK